MRYRLAALMLLAVLPLMGVLAAPVPEPYAILDVGPPRKGETAEEYREMEIDRLTLLQSMPAQAWLDPEVKKLPSVARSKDPWSWLAKNLQVKEEQDGRRLRLTFQAGSRAEKAVILNALLRAYIRLTVTEKIQNHEKCIRNMEKGKPRLAKLLKEERNANNLERWQKGLDDSGRFEADRSAQAGCRSPVGEIGGAGCARPRCTFNRYN